MVRTLSRRWCAWAPQHTCSALLIGREIGTPFDSSDHPASGSLFRPYQHAHGEPLAGTGMSRALFLCRVGMGHDNDGRAVRLLWSNGVRYEVAKKHIVKVVKAHSQIRRHWQKFALGSGLSQVFQSDFHSSRTTIPLFPQLETCAIECCYSCCNHMTTLDSQRTASNQ